MMPDKLDELLGRKTSPSDPMLLGLPAAQTRRQEGDPVEIVLSGAIGKILTGADPDKIVDDVYASGIKLGGEQAKREINAAIALFGRDLVTEALKDFGREGRVRLTKHDNNVKLITASLAHLRATKEIIDGEGFRFRNRPFVLGGGLRLRAHEVIEQIGSPLRDLLVSLGTVTTPKPPEFWVDLRQRITHAAKFDIRSLRAEDIPPNAAFSRELEADGLLRLPYPVCWFEWDIEPGHTVGCVAVEEEDGATTFKTLVRVQGAGWSDWEYLENGAVRHEKLVEHVEEVCRAAVVILGSRSAEKTEVHPQARLNRRRERGGAPPLFSHTVVEIRGVVIGKHGEVTGRTHRSPRMHWRRGHLRHFRNAEGEVYRITPIAPMLVGSETLGKIEHDYVLAPPK